MRKRLGGGYTGRVDPSAGEPFVLTRGKYWVDDEALAHYGEEFFAALSPNSDRVDTPEEAQYPG